MRKDIFPKGRISIGFDDTLAPLYTTTYVQILQNYPSIKCTFYVNPANIGVSGYMSLEQLQTLAAAGHEIANHSWSHANMDGYTWSQLWSEWSDVKDYIINTVGQPWPHSAAIPGAGGNMSNKTLHEVCKELGYRYLRDTAISLNVVPFANIISTRGHTANLPGLAPDNATSLAQIDRILDRVAAGTWVVFFSHNTTSVDNGNMSFDEFDYMCSEIVRRKIPCFTMARLMNDSCRGYTELMVNGDFAWDVGSGTDDLGWQISTGTWARQNGGIECTNNNGLLYHRLPMNIYTKLRLRGQMVLNNLTVSGGGTPGARVRLRSFNDNATIYDSGAKTGTQTVDIDTIVTPPSGLRRPHSNAAGGTATYVRLTCEANATITGGTCTFKNFSLTPAMPNRATVGRVAAIRVAA